MINIREKTFETNSSSCHVITFSNPDSKDLTISPENKICLQFEGRAWGWEFEEYHDAQSKFSYWLNAFIQNNIWELIDQDRKAKNMYGCEYYQNRVISTELYNHYTEKVAEQLVNVFKTFKEKGIEFTIQGYDSYEDYIEAFKHKNMDGDEKRRSDPEFNYLVQVGCGIDHQSDPRESEDCKKLAELSPEDLFVWVFIDGSFKTGNDN